MERTIAPLQSEQRVRNFLAAESENSLRILAPQWWPFKKGEMGSVKGESKSANFRQGKVYKIIAKCEFLARENVNLSPILARQWSRHFRLCLSVSLSLSHQTYLTHNIGSASALPIIYLFALFVQLPFSSLSCAGSSWLPFPLVSFPSFSLLPTPNRPCQSERSSKGRHEADSFEPSEWSERLTPGLVGLARRRRMFDPALALSLFLIQRLYFRLFLQCLYLSLRAVCSAALLLFVLRRFVLAGSSA